MNSVGKLRIILDVHLDLAEPLLKRCRRLFHQQWRRELATLMQPIGEAAPPLRLPPMVLDLGEITLAQFDTQFCQRLLSALAAKLQPVMAGALLDSGVSPAGIADWPADSSIKLADERGMRVRDSPLPMSAKVRKAKAELRPAVAQTVLSQFAGFLKSGVATAALSEHLACSSDAWLLAQLKAEPGAWRLLLAECILKPNAVARLVQSAGDASLSEVCGLLFDRRAQWPAQDKPAWAFCLMVGALLTQVRRTPCEIPMPDNPGFVERLLPSRKLSPRVLPLLADALVQLSGHLPSSALAGWLRLLYLESGQWQHLAPYLSPANRQRLHRLLGEGEGQGLEAPELSPVAPESLPMATRQSQVLVPAGVVQPGQIPTGPTRSLVEPGSASRPSGRQGATGEDQATAMPEEMLVDNAGLVLLWPFLPGMFRRLGLLVEDRFVDKSAQCQAVCWLDGWLWGDRMQGEWRTPLTKLICGLTLETPLFPWAEPDATVLASLDLLLQSLPAQIPTLARCSADDLRRWFLQRPGSLYWKERQVHVQVEPDACDVLLADLPWSREQLLLPWLESPLKVVWP